MRKQIALFIAVTMLLLTHCKTMKNSQLAAKKPMVILKLDDLWLEDGLVHPGWLQVVDFLNSLEIKGTIGIVGNSLEAGDASYFNWIKERHQEGYEIWHHGFCHCRHQTDTLEVREYRGEDLATQTTSLLKTQQLAEEKLGITLHSFGAPYNSTDEHTASALAEMPDLKVWMYKETDCTTDKFLLPRIAEVNIEYPVHHPDFEQFKVGYEQFKNEPVLIIQGHPRSWVEEENRFEEFKRIILFLVEEEVMFVTPYGYYLRE
jgi:peptidoglycan/xylan/chitin deacetylase (PgdA/CDA1 family)